MSEYLPCDPPHDSTDPVSYLNAVEVVALSLRLPPCPHCTRSTSMLPMSGTAWGLALHHEPGCPDHDDALPTPERTDVPLPGRVSVDEHEEHGPDAPDGGDDREQG